MMFDELKRKMGCLKTAIIGSLKQMTFSKIISVFYIIISVISYGILASSLASPAMLLAIYFLFRPLFVVFCIWLVMTIIKLIKKSCISFSEGKIAQGIGLLLVVILLPVLMVFTFYLGVSMF